MAMVSVTSDDEVIVVDVIQVADPVDEPDWHIRCRSCGGREECGQIGSAIDRAEYHADTCGGAEQ
jgi:hypothetical protein